MGPDEYGLDNDGDGVLRGELIVHASGAIAAGT
jgi:hypothetical protein